MSDNSIQLDYLNHACVIIRAGNVKLLCDPWLEGTCYSGGWGLRYKAPFPESKIKECTHLWISHPHTDHMHFGTMKKIAECNPNIKVLMNICAAYTLEGFLKQLGFKNIIRFPERKFLKLTDNISLIRYPTSIIDSMLVFRAGPLTLLNFNDCCPSSNALKKIRNKIGPIDLLLTNFNHAGKYVDYPGHAKVLQQQKQALLEKLEILKPRFFMPFASIHFYRSPFSFYQNESMMSLEEGAALDKSGICLQPMDSVTICAENNFPVIESSGIAVDLAAIAPMPMQNPESWNSLIDAAEKYRRVFFKKYLFFSFWIKPVNIYIEDLQRTLKFHPLKPAIESTEPAHLRTDSKSLHALFVKPYGADDFCIGANFAVADTDNSPVYHFTLLAQLLTNGAALLDIARLCCTPSGLRFFWNRREEIFCMLSDWRYHKNRISRKWA